MGTPIGLLLALTTAAAPSPPSHPVQWATANARITVATATRRIMTATWRK